MTWKLKKCCSFFGCCSANVPRPYVEIARVNRSVRRNSRPPKQKQGLLELLSSYQLTKNRAGADMRDWALQWARSGTLLHLVDIAYRLGSRVDDYSMDLVCLNAALIVSYLPEGTSHLKDLLSRIWHRIIIPKRHSSLGVYRLLLVLVRIDKFRKEVLESEFATQLHCHYHRCIESRPSVKFMTENQQTDEESDQDDVTTSDEEIMDDLLSQCPNEDRQMHPVPKLNFAWLKNSPSVDNVSCHHDHTLSIDKSARVDEMSNSDRSTMGTSNRSENQISRINDGTLAENGSLQKIKNLFRYKKRDQTQGLGHVLRALGLSETIAQLGKLNDSCFMLKYDLLADPADEWRLTSFCTEKMFDLRDREKLAMLEVFLCIGATAKEMPIRHAVINSIVAHTLKIIQTNSVTQSLLQHLIAAYVNFTSAPVTEVTVEGRYVKLLPNEGSSEKDPLLDRLIKECNKLTTIRRPGDVIYDRLALELSALMEYLGSSPQPSRIIQDLIFVLSSIQKMFIKSGNVLQWSESYIQAFRSLLLFHEAAFKKMRSLKETELLEQLIIQEMETEWMTLLKDFTRGLLLKEQFQWLKTQERYDIIVETWRFFTELIYSLTKFKEQTMHDRFLDGFDFLLAPRYGLISIILNLSDAEEIICEQVLRLLIASCLLLRTTFLTDDTIVQYYLKLLTSRFPEQFIKPANRQNSVLALHLQAITSLMECCGLSGLTVILNSKLAELLVGEVHEAALCVAPSTYMQHEFHGGRLPLAFSTSVHQNECYVFSTRPSTGRDLNRQPSPPRTEPVEDFFDTQSDDDVDDALVETLNLSLPFMKQNEGMEELSLALSSSSDEAPSDPPSRRASTTSVEFRTPQRLPMLYEETTIDQIDKYDNCFNDFIKRRLYSVMLSLLLRLWYSTVF